MSRKPDLRTKHGSHGQGIEVRLKGSKLNFHFFIKFISEITLTTYQYLLFNCGKKKILQFHHLTLSPYICILLSEL